MRVILFISIFLFSYNSFACDPAWNPDPWFIYKVELDKGQLPEEIRLTSITLSYRPWNIQRIYSITSGSKEEPIYIVGDYDELDCPAPEDFLEFDDNDFYFLEFLDIYPDFLNLIPVEDGRPDNVEIPESHAFSIAIRYKNKVHSLKGKITFTLNEDYDSTIGKRTFDEGVEACNKWVEELG